MKTLLLLASLLLAEASHAFYDASIGRWISRDPIAERGGVNLFSFVENKPTIGVDPLGLYTYTKTNRTFTVEKCEIVIVYGHGSRTNNWNWKFPSPTCSYGGTITCWPQQNNDMIPPEHRFPGLPRSGGLGMWDMPSGGISRDLEQHDQLVDEEDRISPYDASAALDRMFRNLPSVVAEMCKKNCCPEVRVYLVRQADAKGAESIPKFLVNPIIKKCKNGNR
jgi:uncharacterized protein RhaS with RHS repeats